MSVLRVVALAGGTGSAKILRGLARTGCDLTVVANVGDNVWMHGLYICPDVDIAVYSLAGIADRQKGWGVAGDTFRAMETLGTLGGEDWFSLGDADLGAHLFRTSRIESGSTLTAVTIEMCRRLGVKEKVIPATDDSLETHVTTPKGDLHLQEFWVRERGKPRVTGIEYRGAASARLTLESSRAIESADRIVICPANPITSIGPTLAIPGVRKTLADSEARVTCLSPMRGTKPFSGPAAKLMVAGKMRQDSVGVAAGYSSFLDAIIVDKTDLRLGPAIEKLGVRCLFSDTLVAGPEDELRLARELLAA